MTTLSLSRCQAASSQHSDLPDVPDSPSEAASVSSVDVVLPGDPSGFLTLLNRIVAATEREAAAHERIAAAVEQVVASTLFQRAGNSSGPASQASATNDRRSPPKKRGRLPDTDPEADRKLAERWKASGCTRYADFARRAGLPANELRNAVDRHRHRVPSRRNKCSVGTASSPS